MNKQSSHELYLLPSELATPSLDLDTSPDWVTEVLQFPYQIADIATPKFLRIKKLMIFNDLKY